MSSDVSVILASLYLKVSVVAVLRFNGVFTSCLGVVLCLVVTLVLLSIAVASMYLVVVLDIKRLIAFSSVVHLSIGVVSVGIEFGHCMLVSLLSVLSHSMVSLGMFFCAGGLSE